MCLGLYRVCQKFAVSGFAYEVAGSSRAGSQSEGISYHGQVCGDGGDVDDVAAGLDRKIDEFCRQQITLIDGRRFECNRKDPVVEKSPIQVTKLKGFWDIVFEFFGRLFL